MFLTIHDDILETRGSEKIAYKKATFSLNRDTKNRDTKFLQY